ncbi:MAG: AI-2E family transporter [Clostridia bacterium]|nr:AI-2E family transporter [Clostridia bacterium]
MDIDLKKTGKFLIILLFALCGCYVLSRYGKMLAGIFLPFILARIIAQFLYPPANYLKNTFNIPKGLSCVFITLTFYAALFSFIYILLSHLASEIMGLTGYIEEFGKRLPSYMESARLFLEERIPFAEFSFLGSRIPADFFPKMLDVAGGKITEYISGFLPGIAAFVPKTIIFMAVTVLATCYFAADLKQINKFVLFQLPDRAKIFISECRKQFFSTVSKYFGAYLTIAAITFSELLAGFMLMGQEYAFLISALVTAVDILPLLGAGTVLVPWAAVQALLGERTKAFSLLALYVVITAVRQFAEPRILGSFIGLYPLTALFAIYAGGRLFGIAGLFIFPVAAIILKNLNDKNVISLYRNPPQDSGEKIFSARQKYKRFRKNN